MLNIERAKSIPKSYLSEVDKGTFQIKSRDNKSWTISLSSGTCTCPAFVTTNTPCKHFFAVFHHFPTWSWNDLPKCLTESSHVTLDEISGTGVDTDMGCTNTTHVGDTSEELPDQKKTSAAQIYKLQKQIEDTVARCRTIAFMTNDIRALEEALNHCEAAKNTLLHSATTTLVPGPPVFSAIEKAGVAEFKKDGKSQHRIGVRHKRKAKKGTVSRLVKSLY